MRTFANIAPIEMGMICVYIAICIGVVLYPWRNQPAVNREYGFSHAVYHGAAELVKSIRVSKSTLSTRHIQWPFRVASRSASAIYLLSADFVQSCIGDLGRCRLVCLL